MTGQVSAREKRICLTMKLMTVTFVEDTTFVGEDKEPMTFLAREMTSQNVREKKVGFSSSPPTVHLMFAWSFAYNKARRSTWMQVAYDRMRFQRRINQTAVILAPVLENMYQKQKINNS